MGIGFDNRRFDSYLTKTMATALPAAAVAAAARLVSLMLDEMVAPKVAALAVIAERGSTK